MKIIAVIPAYNEAPMIGRVVREVMTHAGSVVVIDDGSIDQTAIEARRAGATVVRHRLNRGQGAALQTGITFALKQGADVIITFDADGQLVPEEIDRVVEPLLLGNVDVALGSRFLAQRNRLPFGRRLVLRTAALITAFYTGLRVTDTHNGFRAFSRAAAETIEIRHDGMAHASEIIEQIKKHQLRFTEVPVTVRYTDYSLGKGQRLTHSFQIIWDLFFSRLSK